jgi:hypothetical protein
MLIWADSAGPRQTYNCDLRWTITSQNEGTFSGTFQSVGRAPGDAPFCATEGSLTGRMGNPNTLNELGFSVVFAPPNCARVDGSGNLRGTGGSTSLSGQMFDRLSCTDGNTTTMTDRTLTLSMTKLTSST